MESFRTSIEKEALLKLERYCAYQERCHEEVRQKLFELKVPMDLHDRVISDLIQHNFLNETRFACAFARGKFRTKKWGKNRIVNELKFRKISAFNIKIALKEISDEAYYDAFDALSLKRFEQLAMEKNLLNKKRKFRDYLLYRGWESHLIYDRMNDLFK